MPSRLRRERQQRPRRAVPIVLAAIAVVILAVVVIGTGVAYVYVTNALKDLPNVDDPNAFAVAQPTKIYSANGKLLANFYLENREIVPLSAISTDLAHAVVAVEDERFYQHNGVDAVGIARAVFIDITTLSMKEGASTITQQYVRNTILVAERYKITASRKIREMYLAYEFEKRHS
ncbi:MAG TPA: biosynthetic peptidoglycan transglycosylase, partial [Coriobacteriia bacterium]